MAITGARSALVISLLPVSVPTERKRFAPTEKPGAAIDNNNGRSHA